LVSYGSGDAGPECLGKTVDWQSDYKSSRQENRAEYTPGMSMNHLHLTSKNSIELCICAPEMYERLQGE
jgi:hypothetical protein